MVSPGAHKIHISPGKNDGFDLWACSHVADNKTSQAFRFQTTLSPPLQEIVKPRWTTPLQKWSICRLGHCSPQSAPRLSVSRNGPGPWSNLTSLFLSPQPHQLKWQLQQRDSCSKSKDLCNKSMPWSSSDPDGSYPIHKLPGFPWRHSSRIKNTCHSKKAHMGPDSWGFPVLHVCCLWQGLLRIHRFTHSLGESSSI